MADDNVPIPAVTPVPASPAGVIKIKSFSSTGPDGSIVETQAVCITDENGSIIEPLSERTGRDILEVLKNLQNAFCDAFGGVYTKTWCRANYSGY